LPAELITETPEPRGESSLVGMALSRIVAVARVVGHFDATRAPLTIRYPPPQSRADHTYWVGLSQESVRMRQVSDTKE